MVAQIGFEPMECRIQSPMPYRLATGQLTMKYYTTNINKKKITYFKLSIFFLYIL